MPPLNGSGSYVATASTWNPAVTTTTINSTDWNSLLSDLSTVLSTAVYKDGQTTPTANIPMGGFKITGIGAATARTDAASIATIQDGTGIYVATVGGTADAITLTPSPAITGYSAGQAFYWIASGVNTGAATLQVSGLASPKAITKNGSTALVAGDIPSGALLGARYDGTRFQLFAPIGVPSSGGAYSGAVAFPDGTAAAPSVRVGDEQNGLFSPAANQLGVGVAGTQVFLVTSTGVGIGGTPDQKFTVQPGLMTFKNSSGTTKGYLATESVFGSAGTDDLQIRSEASNIIFGFSGTEKARLTSAGALTGTSALFSPITNSISGNVALNNTGTYFTGPTVAQGTSGTWFASGRVTVVDTSAAVVINVKLWDGTTVIDSCTANTTAAGAVVTASLSGYITSPAGNIRISVNDAGSVNGSILFNQSGNSKDSTITAIRIG